MNNSNSSKPQKNSDTLMNIKHRGSGVSKTCKFVLISALLVLTYFVVFDNFSISGTNTGWYIHK
jgi:hypothetical protein